MFSPLFTSACKKWRSLHLPHVEGVNTWLGGVSQFCHSSLHHLSIQPSIHLSMYRCPTKQPNNRENRSSVRRVRTLFKDHISFDTKPEMISSDLTTMRTAHDPTQHITGLSWEPLTLHFRISNFQLVHWLVVFEMLLKRPFWCWTPVVSLLFRCVCTHSQIRLSWNFVSIAEREGSGHWWKWLMVRDFKLECLLFTQLWLKSTTSSCGHIGLKSLVENTTGGVQYPSAELLSDISSTWMCKLVPEELLPPQAGVFDEKTLSSFLRTACSFAFVLGEGKNLCSNFTVRQNIFYKEVHGLQCQRLKLAPCCHTEGTGELTNIGQTTKGHFYHVPILEFFSELKHYKKKNNNTAGSFLASLLESFLFHTFPPAAAWDVWTPFILTVVLLLFQNSLLPFREICTVIKRSKKKSPGRTSGYPGTRCFQISCLTS